MLSRRLIRIKVLQVLYAYSKKSYSTIKQAEKELKTSLERAYSLFFMIILLLREVSDYAEERIRLGKEKKMPTWEDLHPNTRFIENRLIRDLSGHKGIEQHIRNHALSWQDSRAMVKNIYQKLVSSEAYHSFMESETSNYKNDVEIIKYLLSEILPESEDLLASLEEQSIYWNDELEFILSILIRFFEQFPGKHGAEVPLPSLFKNKDDEDFAYKLLHKSILHSEEYKIIIKDHADNWDVDRIARMDILILQQAITEILHFPEIPVRVSINEYIEIARYYSTPKSSVFINGLLDKIVSDLRKADKIYKEGRGLIGEV
ncbi:MAG TPA: transcription antitermination factor NusB [Bacteroidetes bacterium]|nr:transcription antitermination factor NusB [Bacteroidota bacterium]